jgi:hypothetical protein
MKNNYVHNNTTNITMLDHLDTNDNDDEEEEEEEEKRVQKQEMIDKCWIHNKYMLDLSIVSSSEGYSYVIKNFGKRIESYYKIFIDYFGYDEIIIVGAYRRYYDWLPSTYKESIKNYCLSYNQDPNGDQSRKQACRPIWEYLKQAAKALKKNYYNTHHYYNIHETLPMAHEIFQNKTKTRVEILNYFQLKPNEKYYNTITTELYCKVLGDNYTPNTCLYSKNEVEGDVAHHNRGSSDNIPYKLIIDAAKKRNWITGYPLSGRYSTSSNKTTVTSTSNISTWEDLQEYHQTQIIKQQQQQQWTNTNTNNNNNKLLFPLLCPTHSGMKKFLDKSLQFEKLIMPEFHVDKILGKTKHIQDFWNLVEKNDLCSIDIDTYFGNAKTWEEVLYERMIINTNSSSSSSSSSWSIRVDKKKRKKKKVPLY